MSARIASRQALRQSKWLVQRRAASTASEAVSTGAAKAKEAGQEVASKAQSGLSRVASSASSAASAASSSVASAGGRTGQLIGFVQSLVPPTIYYTKVVGELGKIIVQGRGMQPPSAQALQTYIQPLQKGLSNPSTLIQSTQQAANSAANAASSAASNPQGYLARLRNLDSQTLTTTGIVAAEALGFFTIGEMIGRFKIIGYHGDAHAH